MTALAPQVQTKRRIPKALVIGPLVALAAVGAAVYFVRAEASATPRGLTFHTVGKRNLDIVLTQRGELQAVNNIDIVSEVEGSVTIQQIVREGSFVRRGDVLVVLDSSGIRQRIEDATLDVQRAEADLVNAREMLEIQRSQNATNLEAAQVALENARIDLKKYMEGDFPRQLASARAAVQMARINLNNREQDFAQVQDLAARGFLTPTDVKAREVDLIRARNDLNDAETALRNLMNFDQQKTLTSLRSNLAQAEARVARVIRENTASLTQRETDLAAREQTLMVRRRQLERLQRQLAASTITAPEDGLVVYATSGDRNAQQPIQEGAQVRERQMILRLPDTSRMRAVVRIQEAQVTRLRVGQSALVTITGIPEPIPATVTRISVMADNSQRWWNPDLREYPVDVDLATTPPDLKPGVGAEVQISIARLEDVIAIPTSTIYTSGTRSYVFLRPTRANESPQPREIRIGQANETHVQVLDGLSVGDEIVVLQAGQGRELLARAGIAEEAPMTPAFQRNGNGENGRGPGGGPGVGPGGPGVGPGGPGGGPAAIGGGGAAGADGPADGGRGFTNGFGVGAGGETAVPGERRRQWQDGGGGPGMGGVDGEGRPRRERPPGGGAGGGGGGGGGGASAGAP